jgi:predicted nucleotidyltransferase
VSELQTYVDELKFPYTKRIVVTFIGGSQMHGAKLQDTDDTDWYGIFIEPPEKMVGVDAYEHFVHTTGRERGGNRPGDIDVCMYGLKKWAGLVCKGNPSVLHFLFAKPEFQHWAWCRLIKNTEIFLAKSHLNQFLGYANAQLARLLNQRGGKDCHRPFLEEQHGYDTKYAMHITRLLGEAKELMESGRITFPRPNRELLIDIRKGKFKLHELTEMNNQLEHEAIAARDASQLPERVDRSVISEAVAATYREHWNWMETGKWPHEVGA